MDSKIAGTLSFLGALALIAIWLVFLFAARPDCLDSFQLAIASAKYALSPSESGSWLFVFTLASIFTCFAAGLILFFGKQKNIAMYLIATHAVVAMFIYTWSLVLAIALPLIYFGKVHKNA
jgi:ABC-type Na+ efflux pump permease subunit